MSYARHLDPSRSQLSMPPDTLAELEGIIREVQRLTPSWQRPEVFHETKSELLARLRSLARSPVLVRQLVRFVRVAPAAPRPVAVPARTRQASSRRASRPRSRRHRYPLPSCQEPGQRAFAL